MLINQPLCDQHTVRANSKFRRAQLGESQSARCQQVPTQSISGQRGRIEEVRCDWRAGCRSSSVSGTIEGAAIGRDQALARQSTTAPSVSRYAIVRADEQKRAEVSA